MITTSILSVCKLWQSFATLKMKKGYNKYPESIKNSEINCNTHNPSAMEILHKYPKRIQVLQIILAEFEIKKKNDFEKYI